MTLFALILLLCYDTAAFFVAQWLKDADLIKDRNNNPTLSAVVIAMLVAFLFHGLFTAFLGSTVDMYNPIDRMIVIFGSALSGMLPTVAFATLFLDASSHATVDQLNSMDTALKPAGDVSKAKALFMRGDTDGAVHLCREAYRAEPADAGPLYEAARMLSEDARFEESAEILRGIIHAFAAEDEVWPGAAMRLADILEHQLEDPASARVALEEVLRRVPDTPQARTARMKLASASLSEN